MASAQSIKNWPRRRFLADAMEISFIYFSDISPGRMGYFSKFLSKLKLVSTFLRPKMAYRFQNAAAAAAAAAAAHRRRPSVIDVMCGYLSLVFIPRALLVLIWLP